MDLMLAIQLPAWLINIWTTYSDMIVPALVALMVAMLTWLSITIRADAKTRAKKADLELEALKKINDKEDTRPELDAVKTELSDLKQSNTCLAEMFNLVFQNSTLDEETKASLTLLKNKLMSGADDIIKTLTDENAKLAEQVQALLQQLKQASTVTEITETRTRR